MRGTSRCGRNWQRYVLGKNVFRVRTSVTAPGPSNKGSRVLEGPAELRKGLAAREGRESFVGQGVGDSVPDMQGGVELSGKLVRLSI